MVFGGLSFGVSTWERADFTCKPRGISLGESRMHGFPSWRPWLETLECRLTPSQASLFLLPEPEGPVVSTPFTLGAGARLAGLGGGIVGIWSSGGGYQEFAPFPGYTGPLTVQGGNRGGAAWPDSLVVGVAGHAPPHVLVVDAETGKVTMSFYAFDPGYLGGVSLGCGLTQQVGGVRTTIICGAISGSVPAIAVFDAISAAYLGSVNPFERNYSGGARLTLSQNNIFGDSYAVGAVTLGSMANYFDFADLGKGSFSVLVQVDPTFPPSLTPNGVQAVAGDLDGDGINELVVAADTGDASPEVLVYTLRGGIRLAKTFNAFDPGFRGGVRLGLADFDRDGTPDIVAASGPGARGTVNTFRYRDLALIDAAYVNSNTDGVTVGNILHDPWFDADTPLAERISGIPLGTTNIAVDAVRFLFNREVTGMDLSQILLRRYTGPVDDPVHGTMVQAELAGHATLMTADNQMFSVSGLSFFTGELGEYTLTLVREGGTIRDLNGESLTPWYTGRAWRVVAD